MPLPGFADIDTLAFQVGDIRDARVGASDNGHRLRMHREHRAQPLERARVGEFRGAMKGVVLPVGLDDAKLQLFGANCVEIVDRTAGRFSRAADAVFFAVLVHQPANRAAGWVIDAGYTAGADGHEFLLCCYCTCADAGCQRKRQPE